jgi:hypothetical protein
VEPPFGVLYIVSILIVQPGCDATRAGLIFYFLRRSCEAKISLFETATAIYSLNSKASQLFRSSNFRMHPISQCEHVVDECLPIPKTDQFPVSLANGVVALPKDLCERILVVFNRALTSAIGCSAAQEIANQVPAFCSACRTASANILVSAASKHMADERQMSDGKLL